jgi:hypothetical protein
MRTELVDLKKLMKEKVEIDEEIKCSIRFKNRY